MWFPHHYLSRRRAVSSMAERSTLTDALHCNLNLTAKPAMSVSQLSTSQLRRLDDKSELSEVSLDRASLLSKVETDSPDKQWLVQNVQVCTDLFNNHVSNTTPKFSCCSFHCRVLPLRVLLLPSSLRQRAVYFWRDATVLYAHEPGRLQPHWHHV